MHLKASAYAAFISVALFSQQGVQSFKSGKGSDGGSGTTTKGKGGSTSYSCPSGWYLGGSICYDAVVAPSINRANAKTACGALTTGGLLACPDSHEEMYAISCAVMDEYLDDTSKVHYWLGLYDWDNEKNNDANTREFWQCEDSGGNGIYSYFYGAEPNGGTNENCLISNANIGFAWADAGCTGTRDGFVCSVAATSLNNGKK